MFGFHFIEKTLYFDTYLVLTTYKSRVYLFSFGQFGKGRLEVPVVIELSKQYKSSLMLFNC